jgi:acyl-CoA synthetase (AMP-forming)/AMP-acid ligase II
MNAGNTPLDMTLADLLEANAEKYGGRIGYVDGERALTHRQYLDRCCKLADGLYKRGVRHQDRVAILSMNRIEFLEVYGACEVSGFMIATVNYRLATPEVLAVLEDSAPRVVLFEAAYAEMIDSIRSDLPSIETFVCIGDPPDWAESYEAVVESGSVAGPPLRPSVDDIAHLIFTSGTTGRPKGCMLAHRELVRKAQLHAGDMDTIPDDRVLIVMPLFHVGARGIVSAGQWRGAAIHLHRSFDPETFLVQVEAQRITLAHLAPTMVKDVLDLDLSSQVDLTSLRVIAYAAAPMPLPTLRRGLELLGPVFHQAYGQTEGMVSSLLRCQHKPDGEEAERRWLLSVGQAYPGTRLRIVDEAGADVPIGHEGEIIYHGPVMFRGYWNDSVSTLATLRNGWIHSGDLGKLDEDGFLFIVDRKKDMIVSGGENVYSREVEEALLRHESVREAAVIGVPDEKWGEAVHAIVVCDAAATLTETDLIEHCREWIASYKKPRSVTFVGELPRLPNGKINKVALREAHRRATTPS